MSTVTYPSFVELRVSYTNYVNKSEQKGSLPKYLGWVGTYLANLPIFIISYRLRLRLNKSLRDNKQKSICFLEGKLFV